MRLFTTTIAIAALLLTRAAGAAEPAKDTGKGAPSGASSSPPDTNPGGGKTADDISETHDARGADTSSSAKAWEVGAGFEYHRMLISQDVSNGANINVNYYSLYARWDPTPNDRLRLSGGVYERFLVDAGESGARLDDLSLSYTRRIPLPGEVVMRLSAGLTAPTSYGSQLASVYTAPRLSLQVERKFGHLSLDARVGGGGFIVKYASGGSSYNGGGNSGFGVGENGGGATANPKGVLSGTVSADFTMPFHEALSVGVSLYTGYVWFYDVSNGGGCPPGTPSTVCTYGTVMQATTQPPEQSYGGEIYAHYALPAIGGFKTDIGFAYAPLGDSVLGFKSVLGGNGVPEVLATYRENAEVYFSLGARY